MIAKPTPSSFAPLSIGSLVLAAACLALSGCGSNGEDHAPAATETPAGTASVLDAEVTARCGCAIESIGACGNYVLVDGEPFELTGDLGLGHMEFCGKEDQLARVKGTITDGTVAATFFELRD